MPLPDEQRGLSSSSRGVENTAITEAQRATDDRNIAATGTLKQEEPFSTRAGPLAKMTQAIQRAERLAAGKVEFLGRARGEVPGAESEKLNQAAAQRELDRVVLGRLDSPLYEPVRASAFPLAFARDPSLQKLLNDLTQKNTKLAKLRIAMIDLTDLPQGSPGRYASQNDMRSISIDSIAKIAPMYAAYQLRHDLRQYARITKITDSKRLVKGFLRIAQLASNADVRAVARKPPKFDLVLDLDTFSQNGELDFHRLYFDTMIHMIQKSSDLAASICIASLGFEWINALLRQSGLAALSSQGSPNGFFLGQLYSSLKSLNAHGVPAEQISFLKNYPYNWPREPRKSDHKSGTARAIAQFLTLLARGDLVDEASSREMRDLMKDPESLSYFGGSLKKLGGAAYQRIATKVGYLPKENRAGDCALIERITDKGRRMRYVAVGLGAPWVTEESNPPLEELLQGLDTCIMTRNGIKT